MTSRSRPGRAAKLARAYSARSLASNASSGVGEMTLEEIGATWRSGVQVALGFHASAFGRSNKRPSGCSADGPRPPQEPSALFGASFAPVEWHDRRRPGGTFDPTIPSSQTRTLRCLRRSGVIPLRGGLDEANCPPASTADARCGRGQGGRPPHSSSTSINTRSLVEEVFSDT
jgi:hypothetical protein